MFCFLLFHSHCLPLQVRSLWSLNQGISVTSALFSTWTRAPPRTHTAAAGDTTTTWRYAHTPARHLNTQEHTVGLTLFVFSLFCFQKHYQKLQQEQQRARTTSLTRSSVCDWSRLHRLNFKYFCWKCERWKSEEIHAGFITILLQFRLSWLKPHMPKKTVDLLNHMCQKWSAQYVPFLHECFLYLFQLNISKITTPHNKHVDFDWFCNVFYDCCVLQVRTTEFCIC